MHTVKKGEKKDLELFKCMTFSFASDRHLTNAGNFEQYIYKEARVHVSWYLAQKLFYCIADLGKHRVILD